MEENTDDPQVRQRNELEVLQAIYDKDILSVSFSKFLDVSIQLQPSHDSKNAGVHATIVLRVQCTEHYPDKVPRISLSEPKGLSNGQVELLKEQLDKKADELRGEVMIMDLAQYVQDYLRENNKPGNKSFYDQMLERQMLQEQQKTRSEEDRKRRESNEIKAKINQKEVLSNSSDDNSDEDERDGGDAPKQSRRRVAFNERPRGISESECKHNSSKYIPFGNKVLKGKCIEHFEHSVLYFGIDVSNGEPSLIREFILKPQEKTTTKEMYSIAMNQLESIEQELQYLKKFQHDNIVSYLDMKHIVEKDFIVVYIMQQFVSNISLAVCKNWENSLDFSFIRYIIMNVLKGLSFLHQHNICHKNITSSSVYFSKTGGVKLADYSLVKRLEDVQLICRQIEIGGGTRSKPDRAKDIQQIGTMILGLLGVAADPVNPPALPNVPPNLKDFLDMCFLQDDRRWTAAQLLQHAFIKCSTPTWVSSRNTSESDGKDEADEEMEEDADQLIYGVKIPTDLKNKSRLSSEFRVLKNIGSGSFGKVLKAKNRLDGGVYAIKAIELNPRNKQLNKKMIREVKLLSKLNHENVVRYFNSWIEITNVDDSKLVTQVTSTPLQSLTEMQSFRALDPNSGRTANENEGNDDDEGEDLSDDSSDDETDNMDDDTESSINSAKNLNRNEPSESIVFAGSQNGNDETDSAVDLENGVEAPIRQLRSLYIQMEFCEKSTLRNAIDQERLCDDVDRFWRLVREITEGLAYVHLQDMIHRDLKPVNIFLDSYDHVKIGDFGLATTSALSRNNYIAPQSFLNETESDASSHINTENSHTGGVGTSFYVAPELQKESAKVHYSKKVDIYSLGIILFEMSHPPFTTHMERCKTLSNLRLPEIVAPPQVEEKNPSIMKLVRLLLNHDPSKRPNCSDILAGNLLPPPKVEDSELQDVIRRTISNPQSKAYKYMISACFNQKTSLEDDITYHCDMISLNRHHTLQESVRDTVIRIVRRHGARCIPTPLFTPRTDIHSSLSGSVKLVTHSGSVVSVPQDLHIPFARLVARTGMVQMRRYCVERVFKERKTHGYHPREALECAFDLVAPMPGDFTADAEVISLLQEVFNEFPALNAKSCFLRINHTFLLKAILLALGLEKTYSSVFQVLLDCKSNKSSRVRLESELENVIGNQQTAVTLAGLLQKEDILGKIFSDLAVMLKRKEETSLMSKKAMDQLKLILSHADAMGFKIPIKVCPGTVITSQHSSGVMFELVCPVKFRKKKESFDVLASGCRYDDLITEFRKVFEVTSSNRNIKQGGVGVSICLDKVVSVLKESIEDIPATTAVVFSFEKDSMLKPKAEIVRSLRNSGIVAYMLEYAESLDSLESYGCDNRISHLIWLKENERDFARIRFWERDKERYSEKKIPISDVVNFIKVSKPACDGDHLVNKINPSDQPASQLYNIHIIIEEKMAANSKRRYEVQIQAKLASVLGNYSSKPSIQILGLFVDFKILKTIAAALDISEETNELSVTNNITDKYPRQKKYLTKVMDKILSLSNEKNLVLILYSLKDDKYKQVI